MHTKHFLSPTSQQGLLERELLVHSVQMLPPGAQIVELGTGEGGTTLLLLEAGREWDVRIASVDRKHDPALRSSLGALGIECVRGDTATPQGYWTSDRRIDFLLVDASHTYAGVKADWEAWREFLNPHAFVFFHGATPQLAGEFLYVWETIFQKEIATVRGAGALLGGRFAMPGPIPRPPLSPLGEELFFNLMEADLRMWPHQWLGMQPPKAVRRAGRAAGSPAIIAAAKYALGLDEPKAGEEVSLVVSEPADLLVQQLAMQGWRAEQVMSAAPLFREALATALFRAGDERFFALFPDELQPSVRTFVQSLQPDVREALGYGGLAGRVRLLDFVDERRLYAVAESFSANTAHANADAGAPLGIAAAAAVRVNAGFAAPPPVGDSARGGAAVGPGSGHRSSATVSSGIGSRSAPPTSTRSRVGSREPAADVPASQVPQPPPPRSGVHPISEWARRHTIAGGKR